MAVDAETMQHILAQVGCGVVREDSPFRLTREMSALWDQFAAEVAAIDGIVDMPDIEVPDVQVPNPRP
jgi:hypothetical protein